MADITDLSTTDASNTARFPENMAPSAVNDGARALEGIIARWARDFGDGFVTTGGTSTAFTAASNRTISSYYDGLSLFLEFHTAAGASPTLNVDSVGAQSLVWPDGTAVSSDLPAGLGIVCYDLTNTNWVVLSVAGAPFNNLVEDTTPQLGGDLDVNSNGIQFTGATVTDVTGADTLLVSGTAGTDQYTAKWNSDGDLVDGYEVLDEDDMASDSATKLATQQSIKAYVDSSSSITVETEQATTSGTAINFTGIASGANRITVIFEEVSTSSTNPLGVQIGDSGGIETSGYTSTATEMGGGPGSTSDTTQFHTRSIAATNVVSGHMVLTRISGNTWIASHVIKTASGNTGVGGGSKTLSAELDRVRITSGGDTFDNGAVNIFVE